MQPAGLAAFEKRTRMRSGRYSFEQGDDVSLEPAMEREFRKNRKAWEFFQAQRPSYRMKTMWWVLSAKREDTRARRLATLIADSAAGKFIAPALVSIKDRTEARGQDA